MHKSEAFFQSHSSLDNHPVSKARDRSSDLHRLDNGLFFSKSLTSPPRRRKDWLGTCSGWFLNLDLSYYTPLSGVFEFGCSAESLLTRITKSQHVITFISQGILLHGPPGTGKTLMARQIGKMLNARWAISCFSFLLYMLYFSHIFIFIFLN